ncbi:hypothetical protein [Piscinibacter sp.]|uniref:hypothetical protein n=1 Tax=Piscinibacter sp. TaxID=1903157 RepID=UPI0039E3E003
MRVRDLPSAEGKTNAFEVNNLLLTRSRACKIVEAIPGASIMKRSRLFRDTDEFCIFTIGPDKFAIEEPYGDNSRYWIGAKDGKSTQSLPLVRRAFEEHKSWLPPLRTLSAAVAVLLAALLYSKASQFIEQDKCLDSGGRWEAKSNTCSHIAQ